MPKYERLDWFKFYPNDFLADSATAAMDPAALGGYALLLCHAFNGDPPGHLPNDDELLCRLSRLNGRWPELKAQVLRAFELRNGVLVQKRMAQDYVAARRQYQRSVAGGKATQKILRDKRLTSPPSIGLKGSSSFPLNQQPAGVPFPDTEMRPGNSAPTLELTSPPSANKEVDSIYKHKPSSLRDRDRDWAEAFETLFWPKYREWRSAGKAAALKVWMKLPGQSQPMFDRIDAGLDHQIATWKKDGTEEKYRKHASTWLNAQGWLDLEAS